MNTGFEWFDPVRRWVGLRGNNCVVTCGNFGVIHLDWGSIYGSDSILLRRPNRPWRALKAYRPRCQQLKSRWISVGSNMAGKSPAYGGSNGKHIYWNYIREFPDVNSRFPKWWCPIRLRSSSRSIFWGFLCFFCHNSLSLDQPLATGAGQRKAWARVTVVETLPT